METNPISKTLTRLVNDVQSGRSLNINDYKDDSNVEHFLGYLTFGYYNFDELLICVLENGNKHDNVASNNIFVRLLTPTYTKTAFEIMLKKKSKAIRNEQWCY